jgi:hypothetical protein
VHCVCSKAKVLRFVFADKPPVYTGSTLVVHAAAGLAEFLLNRFVKGFFTINENNKEST